MDLDNNINELYDILNNGSYSLTINGLSKHLNSDAERNEKNLGLGLIAEKNNKFLTAGNFKNSLGKNSFYAGGGLKKKYGHNYYISPGFVGGLATGYDNNISPVIMPMLTLGKKDLGDINMMYAPKINDDPAVLMFNLSIPFK